MTRSATNRWLIEYGSALVPIAGLILGLAVAVLTGWWGTNGATVMGLVGFILGVPAYSLALHITDTKEGHHDR